MSSNAIIRLRDVNKCYAIFSQPADRLKQMLVRGRKKYYKEFWALRNISFDILPGHVVGIIGANGAGKSTLLQIITGTVAPTSGEVGVRGRVAALLELGTGFNPEFTGWENLKMNAAIMHMEQDLSEERLRQIESFAQLGDFIHQPVKTYSSGMQARLGFAAAIHSAPDILIVDETLAVGDEAFQRKCLARIDSLRQAGTTVLFVSHSVGMVADLCDSAILLDGGERLLTGPAKKVVGAYQRLLYSPPATRPHIRQEILALDREEAPVPADPQGDRELSAFPQTAVGLEAAWVDGLVTCETITFESHGCEISDVRIETFEGRRVNLLIQGQSYLFRYQVRFSQAARDVVFGMMFRTPTGVEIGGQVYPSPPRRMAQVAAGSSFDIIFPFRAAFTPKTFFGSAGVQGYSGDQATYLHRILDACMLKVQSSGAPATGLVDLSIGAPCALLMG